MVEVRARQSEQSLGPAVLTPRNVQYWCHHTQSFAQSQVSKARKFVEQGCLEYVGDNVFVCGPIEGYNSRSYTIKKGADGGFVCNCQKGREGAEMCSHVLALYYSFKLRQFGAKKSEVVL